MISILIEHNLNKILFIPPVYQYDINVMMKSIMNWMSGNCTEIKLGDTKCILYNTSSKPSLYDGKDIIIYSYGNSCDVFGTLWSMQNKRSQMYKLFEALADRYNVLLYDYNGYGINKTDDKPTEEKVTNTLKNMILNLHKKGFKNNNIVLFGFSLGCGVTMNVISKLKMTDVKGVILLSGFSNLYDIASDFCEEYCYLKLLFKLIGWKIKGKFDNYSNIKKLNMHDKIYLLHSRLDEIISYEHALKLYSTGKCKLLDIDGTHNDPKYNDDAISAIVKI